jgi:MYXO-CTERM domain-containing protein
MRLRRSTVSCTLALGLAAMAGSARAGAIGYTVATDATASGGYTGAQLVYNYNYGVTGFQASGACPEATCTGSGSTDTTGTLTSSYEQTAVSDTGGPYVASGAASAWANLAQGALGVSAGGTYLSLNGSGGLSGGSGDSVAVFGDTLDFSAPGASVNNPVDIGVTFSIDGSFDTQTAQGLSFGDVSSSFSFGNAAYNESIFDNGNSSFTPAFSGGPGLAGWVSSSFSVRTPTDIVFTGIYALTSSSESIGIQAELVNSCGAGTDCDYSDTGAVSLSLPDGVTYTSDSGVFLTQSAESSAPEPAPAALLASGFAALVFLRRRRRA